MCGIYGCIATDAANQVLEGLRKLEYRGYDSAGLAAIFPGHEGPVETERTTGYVSDLVSKANGRFSGANISIGHTRWATHGGVTDSNAHPHTSNDGKITIVHNGIIENASELLERVEGLGYNVSSETDSELIVHLLHHELSSQTLGNNPLEAFRRTVEVLRGSWAIAAIMVGQEQILVAREGAPLVIGRGHQKICVSSDVQPFYGSCSEVAFLNDGDVLSIEKDGIKGLIESEIPEFEELVGTVEEEDKGLFPHMMLKEIHDQPVSLSNVLGGRISSDGSRAELSGFALTPSQMRELDRINFVACGSAFYAAEIGSAFFRKYTDLTVEAFRASEFPAQDVTGPNTLTIAISQSGETKDSLDALQKAKISGGHVSSFCNVIGSTIARFTGNGAYLHAGQEYAVASTKAFTSMVVGLILLSLTISENPSEEIKRIVQQLREIPNKVSAQLRNDDGSLDKAIATLSKSKNAIFIGRGISSSLVEEGALKMMEVAYLPCLAYPGGELKHGPIALIEDGTPVIAVAPTDETLSLMESSIRECKARGAKVILITDNEGPITNIADVVIPTIYSDCNTSVIVNSIPLQMLAYKLGKNKGLNVDRPRNLAKSVTVV